MGKQDTKAPAAAPKKERKIRTIEEQIKDAEARAAELRKRAEAKQTKVVDEAKAKRTKLAEKRDAINVEIDKLTATIGDGDIVGGGPAALGEDTES